MIPPQDLDFFLAEKLRSYRVKMGWPLKRMAEELGVSLQQIQRYEQGVNKISASLLYKLSQIFKTNITSFFEGYEEKFDQPSDSLFRILLVEDDAQDEFLFRKCLEEFSKKSEIFVIKDGADAMDFFSKGTPVFNPDIIFMDLHLPHFQGFDILQSLKRRPAWKNTPVIMITTSTRDEDITRSYHLQSSGFIRKSFQLEEFKQTLLRTLSYWAEAVSLPPKATSS